MSSKFDHNQKTFVCFNFPSTYQCGRIAIPSTINVQHGSQLQNRVFVELPNGSLWRGLYNTTENCIYGLESLFNYYDVKPYNVFVLFCNDSNKFNMEIFNVYGVEICYNVEANPEAKKLDSVIQAVWLNDCYYLSSDIILDKICGQFNYNCYNSSGDDYDLLITEEHFKAKIYNQVLSKNACKKLGMKDISSVEIGFKNLMWKIGMQWINGEVYFNKKWCDFAKEGKLCEGDICVFQKTPVANRFHVAVFQRSDVGNFNVSGVTVGKSVMKWMKVINSRTFEFWEVDVPRLFVEEYGILLLEDVHLILPDGNEFCVRYCEDIGRFRGIQKLCMKYSLKEQFIIFFDYVGRSHFMLSIYNDKGEDIFHNLEKKVMRQEVMTETECGLAVHSNFNINDCVVSPENVEDEDYDVGESFAMELSSKNGDINGHGVYISNKLLKMFGKWTDGTKVNLIYGGQSWLVEVDRKVNVICFEKGWDDFTFANNFQIGQKLNFKARSKKKLEVYCY